MLPHGLYSPSASFQTLLANISAAQRQQHIPSSLSPCTASVHSQPAIGGAAGHHAALMQAQQPLLHHAPHHLQHAQPHPAGSSRSSASLSPPPAPAPAPASQREGSPSVAYKNGPAGGAGLEPYASAGAPPSPPASQSQRSPPPSEDRRSSSIAALRLKAREHEIRLEMMRQNGHHPNDVVGTGSE